MSVDNFSFDSWLRPLISAIVREVLAECGLSDPPKLYDVETAATMLSIPPSWLYERTAKNAIPCHRLGKYIRFSQDDLRTIAEIRKDPPQGARQ